LDARVLPDTGGVRGPLALRALQLAARHAKLGRENLACDPVTVAINELALCVRHRERDPVRQLETALLAQGVDAVDQLVRLALEHELVVEAEVERDRHAVAGGDCPALAPPALDEHLVRCQLVLSDAEASVRQLLELPRR